MHDLAVGRFGPRRWWLTRAARAARAARARSPPRLSHLFGTSVVSEPSRDLTGVKDVVSPTHWQFEDPKVSAVSQCDSKRYNPAKMQV